MLESIPVEMRGISVVSLILFTFGSVFLLFFYNRISKLEDVVMSRCTEIDRLSEMTENLEALIESIKVDNRRMIDWIREDNKINYARIEKSIAELRRDR